MAGSGTGSALPGAGVCGPRGWGMCGAEGSGLGEGGCGCGGARRGARFLSPAVHAAATGVHEEVADRVELQAQLLGDGGLHLLGRPLVLLEDGDQRAALQVCEHEALLLRLQSPLLLLILLLTLAGWEGDRGERGHHEGEGTQAHEGGRAPTRDEEEDGRHKDGEVGHPRDKALRKEREGRGTGRGRRPGDTESKGQPGSRGHTLEAFRGWREEGGKKEEEGPGISANWTTRGEAGRDSQQWRAGQAREPWEDMESRSVGTETKQGTAG